MSDISDFVFSKLSPDEFQRFLRTQRMGTFLQSIEMFSRYNMRGGEAYLVGLKNNDEIQIAALVFRISERFGQKIFSIPGGPVFKRKSKNRARIIKIFLSKTRSFLRRKDGAVLLVNPNLPYSPRLSGLLKDFGCKELGEYLYPKWTMELSLSGRQEEELFASFRRTHKQNIRKAMERYKLSVRNLRRDELRILKKMNATAGAKHGFIAQNLEYFQAMYDAFGSSVEFVAAFFGEQPIAAAMFVLYNKEVIYLYSGSDPKYAKMCGMYAIQWKMICFALKNGFVNYNFYGTRPEPGNGVFEFKAGFRAEVVEKMGTFLLPLNLVGKVYGSKLQYQKFGSVR